MSDFIPEDMMAAIDAYDGPVTVCPALSPAEPIEIVARRIIQLGSTVNSVNVMAGRARRAGHDVRFVGGKKFKPISKQPGGEGCRTLSTTTRTSCE